MSHIRQGAHRIRSRCHQLKIEYYHRKYNNNNNDDDDFSRVVPKRGASISSWSLRTSFYENGMDDDDDGLTIDGDYIQKASSQRQRQEGYLNADDGISIVTVFNHHSDDYQEEDDNFTLFEENDFYHCNCQDEEEKLQSGGSLITNDLKTSFTSHDNPNELNYNDANTNKTIVVGSTAVAGINNPGSNSGKSGDANHSTLFKQYFGSKFDLLQKSIVSLPYTIAECNADLTCQDYKHSYCVDIVDIVEPSPHLYFNNEENLMVPAENAAPVYFDRETPFTPLEFQKLMNVVELNKSHYAVLAAFENCQCAPCQSHYVWKSLDDNCVLIRTSWDNNVGYSEKPIIKDISHCNYWKGPTPLSNSTIPFKEETDENSIDTRFKPFKASRRKSNGNRLLHSKNRFLSTNAAIRNSFKGSSRRKSVEISNNLLDDGYKCESKPTFKIDGSHESINVKMHQKLFPDMDTSEYQQMMNEFDHTMDDTRSATLGNLKEDENFPFNSRPSSTGDVGHINIESHRQILNEANAETHKLDQLVIYNSIPPAIPSAVASIKSTFASLNKFGF